MNSVLSITTHPESPVHDEDGALLERAQRDPAAQAEVFAALYRRYLEPVYYYLYSKVGSRSDAEDLCEQVFLDALEGLPGYRHQGQFAAWLFTIARRRAIDHHRRRRPAVPLDEMPDLPDPAADPLLQVIQGENVQGLARLIRKLDEDDQELLRLRFAAGLGFAQIAALLKRKESAVKMSFYRLLARLESQLEADNA